MDKTPLTNPIMLTSYDYRLVALSILISIFASYAALDLAGRVTAARESVRLAWLAGGVWQLPSFALFLRQVLRCSWSAARA